MITPEQTAARPPASAAAGSAAPLGSLDRDPDAPPLPEALHADEPADRRLSLRHANAVWKRNRDVFLRLWRWLLVPNVAEHAMTMAAIGFGIGAAVSGFGNYAAYVGPGLVVASAMWAAGFECSYGTFYRMKKQRTFDAIVATPVEIDDVVLGELMYGAFRGLVSGGLIAFMFAFLGIYQSWQAVLLVPLSALVGFLLATLAVAAAARAPVMETLGYFVSFILMPMFWLSGIFYRPSAFGTWFVDYVQPLVPMWHAVVLGRQFATGTTGPGSLVHLGVLLAISALGMLLAMRLMRSRLIR